LRASRLRSLDALCGDLHALGALPPEDHVVASLRREGHGNSQGMVGVAGDLCNGGIERCRRRDHVRVQYNTRMAEADRIAAFKEVAELMPDDPVVRLVSPGRTSTQGSPRTQLMSTGRRSG